MSEGTEKRREYKKGGESGRGQQRKKRGINKISDAKEILLDRLYKIMQSVTYLYSFIHMMGQLSTVWSVGVVVLLSFYLKFLQGTGTKMVPNH